MKNYTLSDVVDINEVKELFDMFYDITKIPVSIVDLDQKHFYQIKQQSVCNDIFKGNPGTKILCSNSDCEIMSKSKDDGFYGHRCPNGLLDFAMPIVIAGNHVATIFVGQFLYDDEEMDYDFFRNHAKEHGIDEEKLMKALEDVPRFACDKVEKALRYYEGIVHLLVKQGLSRIRELEAIQKAHANEQKWAQAFLSIPAAILISNVEDFSIIDMNSRFTDMFGYSRNEMINSKIFDDRLWRKPKDLDKFLQALKTGGDIVNFESDFICANDDKMPVLIATSETFFEEKKVYISLIRDISDRKEAEKALLRAEQLAAVGTLAGGIAHEFNNIHTGLLGFIEIVLAGDNLTEIDRDNLETAYKAAERATGVTKNLLAFARKDTAIKQSTSLTQVIRDVIDFIKNEFETEGIEIDISLVDVPAMTIDSSQISQVVMNLLINARHAMIDKKEKILGIKMTRDSKAVSITVSDTGVGIPRDVMKKLFLPFFTTKGEHADKGSPLSKVKGTGLGLSVCDTIIKEHDGKISIQTEVDKGTAITICLPIHNTDEKVIETPEAPQELEEIVCGRILVLDDEEMVRRIILKRLKHAGHEVLGTDDGNMALQLVAEDKFDAAVVDLQMPKMSGVEFIEKLNAMNLGENRPEVIIATGRISNDTPDENSGIGVYKTIYKPFKWPELLKTVNAAIAGK